MHQRELKHEAVDYSLPSLLEPKSLPALNEQWWQEKKRLNMNGSVAVGLCCDVAACIMGRPPTRGPPKDDTPDMPLQM